MILAFSKKLEREALESEGVSVRKARWPNGAAFSVCLTHDVDNIRRPLSHILSVRRRFGRGDFLLAMLGLRSLYNNISLIAEQERARGVRSSFYFLTANYSLKKLAGSITNLDRRGWEIGLHGDFGTHDSAEGLGRAMRLFEDQTGITPRGAREHFLRFDFDRTWELMDRAGLEYDSTVGFRDRIGFPLGLCTPFHPPDRDWRPMRMLELPLVLMDTTLWGYLKRNEEQASSDVDSIVAEVERVHGLFTLLWHQEAVRMKGGRLYPSILDRLIKKHPFIGNGRAVADWWNARSVPLRRRGREFSLHAAPKGMVLRVKTNGLKTVAVHGGKVSTSEEGLTISVQDEEFRLEVQ